MQEGNQGKHSWVQSKQSPEDRIRTRKHSTQTRGLAVCALGAAGGQNTGETAEDGAEQSNGTGHERRKTSK